MGLISVIIPVYNEADVIAATLQRLKKYDTRQQIAEVIVVDGGSTDDTGNLALHEGAIVIRSGKGRAVQMNAGAKEAKGKLLYFLHADTLPPHNFIDAILMAVKQGYTVGCFRLAFNVNHWFLKANTWFTRFDINAFRFGDQSLFVNKIVFVQSGGFREKNIILEDQEIIPRLQRFGKFIVLPYTVVTSARKYVVNGVYKTQAVYFLIYFLYRLGVSQQRLVTLYKKLIRQEKL